MAKNHLIAGYGEIGKALGKIIDTDTLDLNLTPPQKQYDTLHISFPYSTSFVASVKKYQKQYGHKLTIIHSTVPVGTSSKLSAVHSPVVGVHPNLEEGIRTFIKLFGGTDAKKAAVIFIKKGIKTKIFDKSETTEAAKLWDTTYYGWNIVFSKEVARWCKKNKLDFEEVYTFHNQNYNTGYEKLGKKNVVRPVLKNMPGKIGGHCVVPNCKLIPDSPIPKFIIDFNEKI
ncbi:MAG: hypothetical protein AAB682_01960 [Patescibacteria group bacterium]